MENIRIYLVTADDLRFEYYEIVDLVAHLNKIFNARKINLELVPHGKDLGELSSCELFLALYHTNFGDYDKADFENAYTTLCTENTSLKKMYVFFKDSPIVSEELRDFMDIFSTSYGHFFCKFENPDTMKLNFVLQIERYQNKFDSKNLIKFVDNKLFYDTYEVANLENIPFMALNTDYIRMRNDILNLTNDIEQARLDIIQYPEDASFQNELQMKLDARIKVENEFNQHQLALFSTALHIASLSHEKISKRLQRGIEAFEKGNAIEANIILSEAENDADKIINDYNMHQIFQDEWREKVKYSIMEILIKAQLIIADTTLNIDYRIEEKLRLLAKSIAFSTEIELANDQLISLKSEYAKELLYYGKYENSLKENDEIIEIYKNIYPENKIDLATLYGNKGSIYHSIGNFEKSLKYHTMTFEIINNFLNEDHLDIALCYNNIGVSNIGLNNFYEALDFFLKALFIREAVLGKTHPHTAITYSNISTVYKALDDFNQALTYAFKALFARQSMLKEDDPELGKSYFYVGCFYAELDKHYDALEYFLLAQDIFIKSLGNKSEQTINLFKQISTSYYRINNSESALEYYLKAFNYSKDMLIFSYNWKIEIILEIIKIYSNKKDPTNILKYYNELLCIAKYNFEKNDEFVINIKNTIKKLENSIHHLESDASQLELVNELAKKASDYSAQGDYNNSLSYYLETINIAEKLKTLDPTDLAVLYEAIGVVYYYLMNFEKSFEFCEKGMKLRENHLGESHPHTLESYASMALQYKKQKEYSKAIEYHDKIIDIYTKNSEQNVLAILRHLNEIAHIYNEMGNYHKSIEFLKKCILLEQKNNDEEFIKPEIYYFDLGTLHFMIQEYLNSAYYFRKALIIFAEEYGRDSEHTRRTLNFIHKLNSLCKIYDQDEIDLKTIEYLSQGLKHVKNVNYTESLSFFKEAHTFLINNVGSVSDEAHFMEEVLHSVETLNNIEILTQNPDNFSATDVYLSFRTIGFAFLQINSFEDALNFFHRAADGFDLVLGAEHQYSRSTREVIYSTSIAIKNIQNKYQNADENISLEMAQQLQDLADKYDDVENYDEALDAYQKSINIKKEILGKDHLDISTLYYCIALTYSRKENYEKSLEYFFYALEICNHNLGIEDIRIAIIFKNLAMTCCNLHDFKNAMEYAEISFKIFHTLFGNDDVGTIEAKKLCIEIDCIIQALSKES